MSEKESKLYSYHPDGMSFSSLENIKSRTIYFPLFSPKADGIKSSITPLLSGDIKIDKKHYITKPVSTEDLRTDVRNFFVSIKGKGFISLAEDAKNSSAVVEAGPLWHVVRRTFTQPVMELNACNFVPATGEHCELMRVTMTNKGDEDLIVTPTVVVPLFARALANKHDHEHVTSLLHRIEQVDQGVVVTPSMQFNEEGHKPNNAIYYCLAVTDQGELPLGTFPTVDSFVGENGTLGAPEAIANQLTPASLNNVQMQGKEAMGAIQFGEMILEVGESKGFIVAVGVDTQRGAIDRLFDSFNSKEKFDKALEENQSYWRQKADSLVFNHANEEFNAWVKWVTLQPVFRRISGCSFLPDHDYGKGGKGWRDIWQDLLSLILIEPEQVRDTLVDNFGGVRIDGSNATIIGTAAGEFIADRNDITRVWMDHGVWPFLTLKLYVDQTGDYEILLKEKPYFKDPQLSRSFKKDEQWKPSFGNELKKASGGSYLGTVIEHILVQHLVQFFNVGEHNIIRLESADWNDGLDMAFERGESVAFMSLYGGNLAAIADLIEAFDVKDNIKHLVLSKEVGMLFDTLSESSVDYDDHQQKRDFLFKHYFEAVQPQVSGEQIKISIADIVKDLREKSQWISTKIQANEKCTFKSKDEEYQWFNGYYDNQGKRLEGGRDDYMRMTLTGQVFPVMSGVATQEDVGGVVKSVNAFLKDPQLGGIRLNTDFGLPHYLDLGRAFGFAYGTKENGAFFSHMTVMYAYALYARGFAHEGYEVLDSILKMCWDTKRSKIFPGIPEYFDSEGRGRYHYLTGSASWMILLLLTQSFGVRGLGGDLLLDPKLLKHEFKTGQASVECQFASKRCLVSYCNKEGYDFGLYKIGSVLINDQSVDFSLLKNGSALINRRSIELISGTKVTIAATLIAMTSYNILLQEMLHLKLQHLTSAFLIS